MEWTSKRSSIPPGSGEDKGVVRFEDIDGFKRDDIFAALDDPEDELWEDMIDS